MVVISDRFFNYGPDKDQITIIGMEPHPEDKKRAG